MSKYQEQHYEDAARILGPWVGREPMSARVARELIVQDFAGLFAAGNPTQCAHCGDEKGTMSICTRPNEGHRFEGGFDRERFLKACGLEG